MTPFQKDEAFVAKIVLGLIAVGAFLWGFLT